MGKIAWREPICSRVRGKRVENQQRDSFPYKTEVNKITVVTECQVVKCLVILMEAFKQWKTLCINKIDLSKKGSIDEDIFSIVTFINNNDNYFTTSSCSGRIILIDGVK